MSSATELRTPANLAAQVQLTRRAARELARLSAEERNEILRAAANRIEAREAEILEANRLDCETLARDVTSGPASAALMKRLRTSSAGIKDMARQVRDVARLEDPVGRVLATTELDDGLVLEKVSCPLGVIAVI